MKKNKKLKSILSHTYIALIAITFVMTVMNSGNWWLLVTTMVAMNLTTYLVD